MPDGDGVQTEQRCDSGSRWQQVQAPTIDVDRMNLTEEELELAREIKAAVEATPEIDALSDMMYAQFAIVAVSDEDEPPNVDCLLEKILQLQEVRREHRVLETYENGCAMLEQMVKGLLPGMYLSFAYNPANGTHTLVADLARFNSSVLSNAGKVNVWIAGYYYMSHSLCPDFQSIRAGVNIVTECDGYDWRNENMFNVNVLRKWCDFGSCYPQHYASIRHYHVGVFMNLLKTVGKKIVPRLFAKTRTDCEHDSRLDQLFLVPTLEAANERIVSRMKSELARRYKNEASFSLDRATAVQSNPR